MKKDATAQFLLQVRQIAVGQIEQCGKDERGLAVSYSFACHQYSHRLKAEAEKFMKKTVLSK